MKPRKDSNLKVRVEGATKAELWQLALNRHLDVSDLVREALRDWLARQRLVVR
jgi:predicted transcriptional regulator